MKYFPFRWVLLCVLLPAVLYGFTIQGIERYLTDRYTRGIEGSYIGNTEILISGARRLKDVVRENIDWFLKTKTLPIWAAPIEVLVTTQQGNILYPASFNEIDSSIDSQDNIAIASENYSLLTEGLRVSVEVPISFDSPISLLILGIYAFAAGCILYGGYRRGVSYSRRDEEIKDLEIQRLREQEKTHSDELEKLEEERKKISTELERTEIALKSEKAKASSAEEQMFGEIVSLDSKLKENVTQQEQQLREMDALREKILAYEAELGRAERLRAKEIDSVAKRFRAIYKNIVIDDRAADGFVSLPDDMRIKAEEVIHRLNDEPDQVVIKRKVFGTKGRETVLEVLFSYNGRLYFRRTKNQVIEIVVIGTKNSQAKDLEYIDNIPRKS
jgi:hypothetical protein